jgi:hypothetical protein
MGNPLWAMNSGGQSVTTLQNCEFVYGVVVGPSRVCWRSNGGRLQPWSSVLIFVPSNLHQVQKQHLWIFNWIWLGSMTLLVLNSWLSLSSWAVGSWIYCFRVGGQIHLFFSKYVFMVDLCELFCWKSPTSYTHQDLIRPDIAWKGLVRRYSVLT